jgi:D-ribose pyranose/furanose isomerase RbsD
MANGTPVTKADLVAALKHFRKETKADMVALKDELTETMRQIETNLLTEFHRYGKGQQIRLHSLETRDAGIIERLAIIEERLLHLETRRPRSV